MAGRDFYEILGVKSNASQDEIRKAYRKLARKFHPDVNPGDQASSDRFKEISQAYKIIGDPKRREQYDRTGMQDPSAFGGDADGGFEFGGFDFGDLSGGPFSSVFSDLFNRSSRDRRPAGPAAGSDLQYPIRIRFEDAYRGLETRIQLQRQVPCSDCQGSGHRSGSRPQTCTVCGGSGQRERRAGFMRFAAVCQACGGQGRTPGEPCSGCGGRGVRVRNETIRVRIPSGVDTGSQVRVAGKGNGGERGGPPGDLFLLVEVEPHPVFRRRGENLFIEAPITFPEAALGTHIEVPTMEGPARIRIPPATQSGQKIRMRGKGFPSLRSAARGDQFVEIRVVTPRLQDERSKEILREFERLNPACPRQEADGEVFRGKG